MKEWFKEKSTLIGILLILVTVLGNAEVIAQIKTVLLLADGGEGIVKLGPALIGLAMTIYRETSKAKSTPVND